MSSSLRLQANLNAAVRVSASQTQFGLCHWNIAYDDFEEFILIKSFLIHQDNTVANIKHHLQPPDYDKLRVFKWLYEYLHL